MPEPRRSSRGALRVVFAALLLLLLVAFAWEASGLLLLLFIAVLVAVYLSAITDWLQKRLRFPRPLGITVGLLGSLVIFGGIGVLLIPPLVAQVSDLLAVLPARLMVWEASLVRLGERYPFVREMLGPLEEGGSYFRSLFGEIGQYFTDVFPYLFSGLRFLIHLFSVIAMSIFLTAKPGLYRSELVRLVPPRSRGLALDILNQLALTLRLWVGGQLVAMLVLGVLTWVGLELLRVPFALAFGVFTGMAAIVPFFGSMFSTLLPALYVLPSGGLLYALAIVGLGVVVHLFEANLVAPKVFERQVRLPPVWTLLSVLVALEILGPIGMIVAVPILAVLRVLVQRLYVDLILEGKGPSEAASDEPLLIPIPPESGISLVPGVTGRSVPAELEGQAG